MKHKMVLVFVCVLAAVLYVVGAEANTQGGNMTQATQTMEAYTAVDYPVLSKLSGFSAQLMANHTKLYQGYVSNTNMLAEKLADMGTAGKAKTPEYAEMKRRFGWEFNGMRLHELYFSNIGGSGVLEPKSPLYVKIQETFRSVESWKKDFASIGAMRGIGWVVLYKDNVTGRLFNVWINEHDGGHLAGCTPLLVMDVFEHAYMLDYQLDKARYIDAFFNVISWEAVAKRMKE